MDLLWRKADLALDFVAKSLSYPFGALGSPTENPEIDTPSNLTAFSIGDGIFAS